MQCPSCNENLKRKWNFCPNCGSRVSNVSAEDRAHILESIVRVAKANPDEWQGLCEALLDYVGISPDEVRAALPQRNPKLFNLDDKAIDAIFAKLGVTDKFVPGAGSYGLGVRKQVFEIIVRQALAGAPWREICAGPMRVSGIRPEEVEAEVARRRKPSGQWKEESHFHPRALLGLPSQHQFRQLQERVEQALSKPLDLNETLVGILKGDVDLRKLILNMIVQGLLAGNDWNEGMDRWIKLYEISAREIEEEIRRRVRGEEEDSGPPLERVPRKPLPVKGDTNVVLSLPKVKQRLVGLREKLAQLMGTDDVDADTALERAIEQIDILISTLLNKLPRTFAPAPEAPESEKDTPPDTDTVTGDDKQASGS
jgi:hypothetical protein